MSNFLFGFLGNKDTSPQTEKLPAIPQPGTIPMQVYQGLSALKQFAETLAGTRGSGDLAYVSRKSLAEQLELKQAKTQVVVLASDFANSNAVITDVTTLQIAVEKGQTWEFEAFGLYRSNTLTNGIGLAITGPASTCFGVTRIREAADGFDSFYEAQFAASGVTVMSGNVVAINTDYVFSARGFITTNDLGYIKLRARSEVNTNVSTVRAGTILRASRIA